MLPDIPGKKIEDKFYLSQLQEVVCRLLESDSNPKRFPGAQPISFAGSHMQELQDENYFVSEKADGIRCLFFTRKLPDGNVETYLIDRKNNYYQHQFGLPLPGGKKPHRNTILDGELVIEKGRSSSRLMFMFFDALVVDEKLLIRKPYTSRLGYLRDYVVKPYLQKCEQQGEKYRSLFPFKMTQKRVSFSYELVSVFEDMQKYGHKTDGLIFTSADAHYTLGTSRKMLKWKPSEENTVDFKVSQHPSSYHIGILVKEGDYRDYGEITLDDEVARDWDSSGDMDGRIIECRWDPEWPNHWRFARMRDDKLDANHISVYEKILESINDNVTKEELIDAVDSIYDSWKVREPSIKPLKSKPKKE